MTGDQPAPAERKPRVVIEFAGVGLAECTITPDPDVSLAQLYTLPWLIDTWAKEARAGQLAVAKAPLVGSPAGVEKLLASLGLGVPSGDS